MTITKHLSVAELDNFSKLNLNKDPKKDKNGPQKCLFEFEFLQSVVTFYHEYILPIDFSILFCFSTAGVIISINLIPTYELFIFNNAEIEYSENKKSICD